MSTTPDQVAPVRVDNPDRSTGPTRPLSRWLLANRVPPVGREADEVHSEPQA